MAQVVQAAYDGHSPHWHAIGGTALTGTGTVWLSEIVRRPNWATAMIIQLKLDNTTAPDVDLFIQKIDPSDPLNTAVFRNWAAFTAAANENILYHICGPAHASAGYSTSVIDVKEIILPQIMALKATNQAGSTADLECWVEWCA